MYFHDSQESFDIEKERYMEKWKTKFVENNAKEYLLHTMHPSLILGWNEILKNERHRLNKWFNKHNKIKNLNKDLEYDIDTLVGKIRDMACPYRKDVMVQRLHRMFDSTYQIPLRKKDLHHWEKDTEEILN